MPTTIDLLNAAIENQPIEFGDAFNGLLGQKVADALASKRQEIAQTLYGVSEEGPEEEDDDVDFDDDDDDDDIDFDDDDDDFDDDVNFDDIEDTNEND